MENINTQTAMYQGPYWGGRCPSCGYCPHCGRGGWPHGGPWWSTNGAGTGTVLCGNNLTAAPGTNVIDNKDSNANIG